MHRISMVLCRFSGTPYDSVPVLELVQAAMSGVAIGVSDIRVAQSFDQNIAVSFFWAGHGLPVVPNNYIARFGLAKVADLS